jgi:monomeric isocitrate dehydrogenase
VLSGFTQLVRAHVKDDCPTAVGSRLGLMSRDAKEYGVHTQSHITEETRTLSVLQASCCACSVPFASRHVKR